MNAAPPIRVSTKGFLAVQPLLYASAEAVAGEMLQNAQRAGATEVEIAVDPDGFTVADNGRGCSDWSRITTIAESGWEDTSQDPFGLGFWSLSAFASQVAAESGDTRLEINMNAIREGRDPAGCAQLYQTQEPRQGFKVIADCRDAKKAPLAFSHFDMRQAVRRMAAFLDLSVKLNGQAVEPFDEARFLSLPWARKVKIGPDVLYLRPMPDAWNWATKNPIPGTEDQISVIYQRRPVCKTDRTYLWGALVVNRNLDLRAPDRSEPIRNTKWKKLMARVAQAQRDLFLGILRTGSDEDLDTYAEGISRLVGIKDLTRHVRFEFLEPVTDARKAAAEDRSRHLPEPPARVNVRESRQAVYESLQRPVSEAPDIAPEPPEAPSAPMTPEDVEDAVTGALSAPETLQADGPCHRIPHRSGVRLGTNRIYYATKRTNTGVDLALRFGAPVALIRNSVEKKLAEAAPNMLPVSKVQENIHHDVRARAWPPANSRQERALRLLRGLLIDMTGEDVSVTLADVDSVESLRGGVLSFPREEPLLAARREDTIYLDRALVIEFIEGSNLKQNRAHIGLPDVAFLALCAPHLAPFVRSEMDAESRRRGSHELVMEHISRLIACK